MVYVEPDQIWMVVVGFIVAFALAFGIGANDVANSFGTSVGSKVLTLKQACILASIFETLGAVFLGAKVSDTIRKGIIDIEPYANDTHLIMVGNVAALSGSCIWMFCATLLRLPVSATHSIVGATVGFALVAHGAKGIHWSKLGLIMGSWFISPVMSGLVSTLLFYLCRYFILSKEDPLEPGLRFLPIFYASTVVINLFSIFYEGPEMFAFDKIPLWGTFIISFGGGTLCAILIRVILVPWQRKRIKAAVQANAYVAATAVEESKKDQVKFTFGSDNPGVNISVNTSVNTSLNTSRASSIDCDEKPPLFKTSTPLKVDKATDMEEDCENANENIENIKNLNNKYLEAATNLVGNQNTGNNLNMGNGLSTGKVLLDITNLEKKQDINSKPKLGVAKINKNEDAPLMDNEYNLGQVTPVRSPTCEDLIKKDTSLTPPSAKKILNSSSNSPAESIDVESQNDSARSLVSDHPETEKLFSFLQILTAVFGAFAHGGNDVSNAIGPLVSLWLIATTFEVQTKALTPIWILFYGGVGISVGLWIWGPRVIKTIGEDLTKITPSSGFCIEVGSALTVLIASNVGIPISTTHCKIGSIVFVGRFRSRKNVDWSIFRNIILAWLVTLPFSGGLSAAIMALLNLTR